jgi:hypothetical protein
VRFASTLARDGYVVGPNLLCASFFDTLLTETAFRFYILVPKFFPIIVVEFFSRFDIASRVNIDLPSVFIDFGFGIRAAGMVDVSREILATFAIDDVFFIECEKILSAASVSLIMRNFLTRIFDNKISLFDILRGKKSKPCTGAFHFKPIGFFLRLHKRRV